MYILISQRLTNENKQDSMIVKLAYKRNVSKFWVAVGFKLSDHSLDLTVTDLTDFRFDKTKSLVKTENKTKTLYDVVFHFPTYRHCKSTYCNVPEKKMF